MRRMIALRNKNYSIHDFLGTRGSIANNIPEPNIGSTQDAIEDNFKRIGKAILNQYNSSHGVRLSGLVASDGGGDNISISAGVGVTSEGDILDLSISPTFTHSESGTETKELIILNKFGKNDAEPFEVSDLTSKNVKNLSYDHIYKQSGIGPSDYIQLIDEDDFGSITGDYIHIATIEFDSGDIDNINHNKNIIKPKGIEGEIDQIYSTSPTFVIKGLDVLTLFGEGGTAIGKNGTNTTIHGNLRVDDGSGPEAGESSVVTLDFDAMAGAELTFINGILTNVSTS